MRDSFYKVFAFVAFILIYLNIWEIIAKNNSLISVWIEAGVDVIMITATSHMGCLWCQHPIWAPVWVPDAPFSMMLPINDLGKVAKDGPSVWNPTSHVGISCETPEFAWPSPGYCGHLGINQERMEDFSHCLRDFSPLLSLSNSLN